jgi:hypothetical protein
MLAEARLLSQPLGGARALSMRLQPAQSFLREILERKMKLLWISKQDRNLYILLSHFMPKKSSER